METHVIAIARPAEGKAERVDSLIRSVIAAPSSTTTHPDSDITRYRLYGETSRDDGTGRIAMVETHTPSLTMVTDPTSTANPEPLATSAASPELVDLFKTLEEENLLAAPADMVVMRGVGGDSPADSPASSLASSPTESPRGSLAATAHGPDVVDAGFTSVGKGSTKGVGAGLVVGPKDAEGIGAWY